MSHFKKYLTGELAQVQVLRQAGINWPFYTCTYLGKKAALLYFLLACFPKVCGPFTLGMKLLYSM